MLGAARSGPEQAQERARSRGHTLHAAEDRTLRLAKKMPSCGQRRGIVGNKQGTAAATTKGWRAKITRMVATGSRDRDEQCHGHRKVKKKGDHRISRVDRGSYVRGEIARRGRRPKP